MTAALTVASIAAAVALLALLAVALAPWALSRIAEARRRALIVQAAAEFAASSRIAEAAKILGDHGLDLRRIHARCRSRGVHAEHD